MLRQVISNNQTSHTMPDQMNAAVVTGLDVKQLLFKTGINGFKILERCWQINDMNRIIQIH